MTRFKKLFFYAVLMTLASCGGSGQDQPPAPPSSDSSNTAPPQFSSSASVSVSENQIDTFYQAVASGNGGVSYALDSSGDSELFTIDSATGDLVFKETPDFEDPKDSNTDNVYQIAITATDGNDQTSTLSLEVSLLDVSNLEFSITYPTQNANLGTNSAETSVTGAIRDLEDGQVLSSDVAGLSVNDVSAELIEGNSRWTVKVPLSETQTSINAELIDKENEFQTSNLSIFNELMVAQPGDLIVDQANNRLIINDGLLRSITSIDLETRIHQTISSEDVGEGMDFRCLSGMALDASENKIFAADTCLKIIFEVDISTGNREILFNYNSDSWYRIDTLKDIIFDPRSRKLHISAYGFFDITRINIHSINVDTNESEVFERPFLFFPSSSSSSSLALGDTENQLRFISENYKLIYELDLETGSWTSTDSEEDLSESSNRKGAAYDQENQLLYTVDRELDAIISIDVNTGVQTLVSGASAGQGEPFYKAYLVAFDQENKRLFAVDESGKSVIEVDPVTGDRTTIADTSYDGVISFDQATAQVFDDRTDKLYLVDSGLRAIYEVNPENGTRSLVSGSERGSGELLRTYAASAMSLDKTNNRLLIANAGIFDSIDSIDIESGDRSVLFTEEGGDNSQFGWFTNLVFDSQRNVLYVSDAWGAIYTFDLASNEWTTLSNEEVGSGPQLEVPEDVILSPSGNEVFVSDSRLGAIFSIDIATGDRIILSNDDNGSGESLLEPFDLTLDQAGNRLLVTDNELGSIVAIDLATGNRAVVVQSSNVAQRQSYLKSLSYDGEKQRLYSVDTLIDGILVIDMVSEERAVLSR